MEGILGQLGGKEVIVDPATTEVRNVYKLMVAAIVPRPIAFVSTIGADGILNLAPFSFFTAASADPPVICFAPMIRANAERDGGRKDTLRNIQATGEFVVNIVSEEFAAQMNICSAEFPPEIDEFQASGLTPQQLADSVTEKLRKYIADPRVTVVVTAINSKRIYLVGEVMLSVGADV